LIRKKSRFSVRRAHCEFIHFLSTTGNLERLDAMPRRKTPGTAHSRSISHWKRNCASPACMMPSDSKRRRKHSRPLSVAALRGRASPATRSRWTTSAFASSGRTHTAQILSSPEKLAQSIFQRLDADRLVFVPRLKRQQVNVLQLRAESRGAVASATLPRYPESSGGYR
jgi:hypothetical protein